jgi:hypothetical protein
MASGQALQLALRVMPSMVPTSFHKDHPLLSPPGDLARQRFGML